MLRLSKKMSFALEAVVDIAYHAGAGPVQSKDITARQGIPQRYLEQVMQRLVRAGILKGTRGPRGGYRLARERRRVTLGDVARVVYDVEGGNGFEYPSESVLGRSVVAPLWRDLEETLMTRLDAVTIEDLCRHAREVGVGGDARAHLDFTI
ncbi:MAG TPA: Rrf2 family transcriptional regulator [Alphaproteobacteria bacterium]|nr:Rrf2 family transcriptional regulator [Alphaproteobacteria bacterium]